LNADKQEKKLQNAARKNAATSSTTTSFGVEVTFSNDGLTSAIPGVLSILMAEAVGRVPAITQPRQLRARYPVEF